MADTVDIDDSTDKSPAWATILYPESCSPDYIQIIRSSRYPCLLSPLHDRDIEDDGITPKKPHFHLMVWFKGGGRRRSQIEKLRVQLKGVGVLKLDHAMGYARYLCHLDDPDKVLYDTTEVISFGGLNYNSLLAKSVDTIQATVDLIKLARECKSYAQFVNSAVDIYPTYIGVLTSKSYFFNNFISSGRKDYYESKITRLETDGFRCEGQADEDLWNECPFHNSNCN